MRRTLRCLDGGVLEFAAISVVRLVLLLTCVFIRLLVSSLLLVVGVLWLQSTRSVAGIILNTAALSFIMDFDELVFVTIVSSRAKVLIKQLVPLPTFMTPCLQGHNVLRPLMVFGGIAVLLVTTLPELQSNLDSMDDLDHLLCGGSLDFVYHIMPSTGFIVTEEVAPYEYGATNRTFEYESLEEVVLKIRRGA